MTGDQMAEVIGAATVAAFVSHDLQPASPLNASVA